MMSAKLATLGHLKLKVPWKKFMTWRHQQNLITGFKLTCRCGHVTLTLALIWENSSYPQLYKDLTKKLIFLKGAFGSSSIIWDWHQHGLEVLHQYGKRIKTKSQKDFGVNSYVCKIYRGKNQKSWVAVMLPVFFFNLKSKNPKKPSNLKLKYFFYYFQL